MRKDILLNLASHVPPDLILNTTIVAMELSRRDFIKAVGVTTAGAALAACQTPEPTVDLQPQQVDISKIHPEGNVFLNKELFGKIVKIREFETPEIEKHTPAMVKAAREMGWNDENAKIEYTGIVFEDHTEIEVPIIIAYHTPIHKDGQGIKQAYLYTAFDEENLAFVPVNQTNENARGRYFPIFPFQRDDSNIVNLGLGKISPDLQKIDLTVPMFSIEYKNDGTINLTAYEPYSLAKYTIKDVNLAPNSVKKVIAELTPLSENYKKILEKLTGTDFTLNANGEIEVKDVEAENGKTVVKGIKVNQDGSAVVSYQGENKDHQGKTYKIKGEVFIKNLTAKNGIITFTDEDGVLWTYDHAKSRVLFPELTREMNLPKEFPDIDLGWALTAPEFDQRIFDLQEKGRFVELTGEAIPIEPGDLRFNYTLNAKIAPAFVIKDADKFDSKSQFPVQLVAIYDFNIDGYKGNLLIERWTDKSGKPKFRKVIVPPKTEFEGLEKQLLAQSADLGYNSSTRFPCGYLIFDDLGLNNFAEWSKLSNQDSFKQFYKKHKELFELSHNLYKELNTTGEFDNEQGIPVVLAGGFKIAG